MQLSFSTAAIAISILGELTIVLQFNLEQNSKQFVSKTNDEVNLSKLFVIFSEEEVNLNCNLILIPLICDIRCLSVSETRNFSFMP